MWQSGKQSVWKTKGLLHVSFLPCRQVQEQRVHWDVARANGSTEKVALTVEGEPVLALPLWVAVHQEREGGLARWACSEFCVLHIL